MLTSKLPFTTQCQQCGQAVKLIMSFPFRSELVAENTFFGTQQEVWRERLWSKSVLEENIRTVPFTTGGSQRLLCVGIFIQSFERQASGTVLRLSARKLYWCRLHFWSECNVSSLRIINACQLFHVNFNALFYSAHHNIVVLVSALHKVQNENYITMQSVTTRRFKKSATLKQVDLISSKYGQYRVKLISRIVFVSSVSYKFLSNTHLYFLIACSYDATCHFCNCACYCTKHYRHCECQTTVS